MLGSSYLPIFNYGETPEQAAAPAQKSRAAAPKPSASAPVSTGPPLPKFASAAATTQPDQASSAAGSKPGTGGQAVAKPGRKAAGRGNSSSNSSRRQPHPKDLRRSAAFEALERLLEEGAESDAELWQVASVLTGDEYLQVAEERALAGLCGSALCRNEPRSERAPRRLAQMAGDFEEQKLRSLFCSTRCQDLASAFAERLGTEDIAVYRFATAAKAKLEEQRAASRGPEGGQASARKEGGQNQANKYAAGSTKTPIMFSEIKERDSQALATEAALQAARTAASQPSGPAAATSAQQDAAGAVEGYIPRQRGSRAALPSLQRDQIQGGAKQLAGSTGRGRAEGVSGNEGDEMDVEIDDRVGGMSHAGAAVPIIEEVPDEAGGSGAAELPESARAEGPRVATAQQRVPEIVELEMEHAAPPKAQAAQSSSPQQQQQEQNLPAPPPPPGPKIGRALAAAFRTSGVDTLVEPEGDLISDDDEDELGAARRDESSDEDDEMEDAAGNSRAVDEVSRRVHHLGIGGTPGGEGLERRVVFAEAHSNDVTTAGMRAGSGGVAAEGGNGGGAATARAEAGGESAEGPAVLVFDVEDPDSTLDAAASDDLGAQFGRLQVVPVDQLGIDPQLASGMTRERLQALGFDPSTAALLSTRTEPGTQNAPFPTPPPTTASVTAGIGGRGNPRASPGDAAQRVGGAAASGSVSGRDDSRRRGDAGHGDSSMEAGVLEVKLTPQPPVPRKFKPPSVAAGRPRRPPLPRGGTSGATGNELGGAGGGGAGPSAAEREAADEEIIRKIMGPMFPPDAGGWGVAVPKAGSRQAFGAVGYPQGFTPVKGTAAPAGSSHVDGESSADDDDEVMEELGISGATDSDEDESMGPWFGGPPRDFRNALSPFGTLFNLVDAWTTSQTTAHLCGTSRQPARDPRPPAGPETSHPDVEEEAEYDRERDGDGGEGPEAAAPEVAGHAAAVRAALARQLARALPGILREMRIAVPRSEIEAALQAVLLTMRFPAAMPSLPSPHWTVFTLLLIKALSLHRLPQLQTALDGRDGMQRLAARSAACGFGAEEFEALLEVLLGSEG